MDERQDKLQVGAGLQESRLNTDLIQWLEKWGTHILSVVAVIVLGYVGLQYWGKYQDSLRDNAFSAYEAARGTMGGDGVLTGNPGNLVLVADEHDGIASVWQLAKLDAADIWLGCAWRGLRPGTEIQAHTPEDILTEEQIATYLNDAKAQYEQVLARVRTQDNGKPFQLRALDGLYAVALSQGDRDAARGHLEQLAEIAGDDYGRAAGIARFTLARLDAIPSSIDIVDEAKLPASANAPIQIDTFTPPITTPELAPGPMTTPDADGDTGDDDGEAPGEDDGADDGE
ncbi:MAG: tetratricopeptide repeat protein [Phycisphaerales bacterium]